MYQYRSSCPTSSGTRAKHVETLLLSGFLGPSSEKEHTRLYFDADLGQYVEIPNEAILYSQQIPKESSLLGGAYVCSANNSG